MQLLTNFLFFSAMYEWSKTKGPVLQIRKERVAVTQIKSETLEKRE